MPRRPLPNRPRPRRIPAARGRHRRVHPILLGIAGIAIIAPLFGSCGAVANSAPPAPVSGLDIPNDYLALYRAAGNTCPGLDWAVLAAIGRIETNHGRSDLPGVHSGANSAGAMGEMQFEPDTWDAVRARHPQIGPDVYNPADAIPAAAWYLCDSGASRDLKAAVFQYNHADWYVREVLDQAAAYRTAG